MNTARRILTWFLVFLMTMNTVGYYAFLVYLRNRAAVASVEKIQTNLNEPGANLIVKLPLAIPYVMDSKEFEFTSGHFLYDGKVYQTIKQKLYQDTLYLICIHDQQTTDANNKISDFARSFAGEGEQQAKALKVMAIFAKYNLTITHGIQQAHSGWMTTCEYAEPISSPEQDSIDIVLQPPRLNC